MKDKAEFILKLNPQMLLDLCDKDPELEVMIKKSALNYLRNSMLKPLMKKEIVHEIEDYKKDIKNHVNEALKDLGIKEPSGWSTNYVLLSDKIKNAIKTTIIGNIDLIVSEIMHNELNSTHQKFRLQIEEWKRIIKNLIEKSITNETIKNIAKEVIENKLK